MKLNYAQKLLKNIKKFQNIGIKIINDQELFYSYRELYDAALIFSKKLENQKLYRNVIIIVEESIKDFIIQLWGTILSNNVPVCLDIENELDYDNFLFIWKSLGKPRISSSVRKLITDSELNQYLIDSEKKCQFDMKKYPDDVFMISYSSGSTSQPKGIVTSCQSFQSALISFRERYQFNSRDTFFNWMPLTHAIGLNIFHFMPLLCQCNQIQYSKEKFIKNSTNFIERIKSYKASVVAFTEFGMKLFADSLDSKSGDYLSNLRLVFVSSEIISRNSYEYFLEKAQKRGLRECVVKNLYGMTESVLGISSTIMEEQIEIKSLNFSNLLVGEKIEEVQDDSENSISFISSGKVFDITEVVIVDDNKRKLKNYYIGNILVKGKNITNQYIENNSQYYYNGYLITGDIGYFDSKKNLTILSRSKDILIHNGKNYFVIDIENFLFHHFSELTGKLIISQIDNQHKNEKDIVCFVEGDLTEKLKIEINKCLLMNYGFTVLNFYSVDAFPRENSGKLSRKKLLFNVCGGCKNV